MASWNREFVFGKHCKTSGKTLLYSPWNKNGSGSGVYIERLTGYLIKLMMRIFNGQCRFVWILPLIRISNLTPVSQFPLRCRSSTVHTGLTRVTVCRKPLLFIWYLLCRTKTFLHPVFAICHLNAISNISAIKTSTHIRVSYLWVWI